MATQSYAQIQSQIAELAAQAEKLKAEEIAGVVARIKQDIATYGLSAQDLFGRKSFGARTKARATVVAGAAKYADGKGGVYGGRGPHPKWLREALAAGKKLEDFLFGGAKADAAAEPARKAAAKKGKAAPGRKPGRQVKSAR
ncbi:MAG: H-NS histone family protein [Burkholderiales bacterium]|nr:H-NS histone family protein [Burkholderiales bacterium]MDE2397296.1 H-NS histone family protein [Burkholderiales bacterium]MDE2452031.1 H-NS histone family protein [Burkholderiales bacterium]